MDLGLTAPTIFENLYKDNRNVGIEEESSCIIK